MSTRTPVSASVIKSTSRFAPKAVPRKQQSASVPPPKATPVPTIDEESESEDDIEEEDDVESLNDQEIQPQTGTYTSPHGADFVVEQRIGGIPPIQSSIPPTIRSSNESAPPPSTVEPIRSLRSRGPVSEDAPSATASIPTISSTVPSSRKRRAPSSTVEPSRRGRRKSTPPAAEDVVISPATTKMSEMCVDKRTGRRSSRYAELREAERQRRRLKELKRDRAISIEPSIQEPTPSPDEDDSLQPLSTGTTRVMTDSDGHIIVDPSSLQVDRHAIHPSTLTESLVHTTETIFSSKTNSATYASTRTHVSNTVRWFPNDNERFYNALQMFGTDFGMIATFLGGGKSRRHVKNKFYKEEKKNSDKLTWALKNRIDVDIAALEEQRGQKLKSVEEMKEELEGLREEARIVMALPRLSQSVKSIVNDETGGDV